MSRTTRMQELGQLIEAGFTFRGGAPDDEGAPADDMFPALPLDAEGNVDNDAIAAFTDEELGALYDEMLAVVAAVDAGDTEVIGDRTAPEIIAAMTAGVEAIELLRAERDRRDLQSEQNAAELAELTRRALGNDDEPEEGTPAPEAEADEGEGGEPAAPVEEPEAIAAAGTPVPPVRPSSRVGRVAGRAPVAVPPARRQRITVNEPPPGLVLTAAGDVPGFSAGANMDWGQLADAFAKKYRSYAGSKGTGAEQKIPIATVHGDWPEERMLHVGDFEGNSKKIKEVLTAALTADGGLCAPVQPYYGLEQISETMRPVRDMLPRFGAERGGIQFAEPPVLGDITTAVGVVTEAHNALGGSWATKTCQRIPCPEWHEIDVDSIYHCLTVDNLGARAWPELIRQFTDVMMAGFARTADTRLIDGMVAQATASVTGAAVAGATSTLLGQILELGAGMRSRHRMSRNRVLRALFPQWVQDLLLEDLIRQQFGRFDTTADGVVALLRSFNIDPVFTPDGPSGGGQVFTAQGNGAGTHFPTTVKWLLFPEGSYLWLDSGVLELGLVRDSVLNAQNNFQQFGETFESVAFVGVESLYVTTTLCPNGATTAPVTVSCPLP